MPNAATSRGVGRDRDEVVAHRVGVTERGDQPLPRRARVGQRLDRGEGLRRDDEEGLGRVQSLDGVRDVRAVDVGDEAHRQPGVGHVAQRAVGHGRAEVGSADADVDHVADPLAGGPGPGARAHSRGQVVHPVQDLVDIGHHVVPIHLDHGVARGPQGDVQHRAALGDVDAVAAEHRLGTAGHAGPLRHRGQQLQGVAVDTVLGVVEVQIADVEGQLLAARGVVVEQSAQMQGPHGRGVRRQRLPLVGTRDHCFASWYQCSCRSVVSPVKSSPSAAAS